MKPILDRIEEAEAESLWNKLAGVVALICILVALFG